MDEKSNYDDIINIEYKGIKQMKLSDRAKIFLPFAALKGFEEAIEQKKLEYLASIEHHNNIH